MGSCQILWKNLRKSRWDGGEKAEKKFAQKLNWTCSGCSVSWKNVRFREFVFGFWEKYPTCSGKTKQIEMTGSPQSPQNPHSLPLQLLDK